MIETVRIAQLGELVLRNPAKLIEFCNPEILELIDTLINTAIAHQGVGIAAPQISQPYRLFIIASHPSDRYPHAPTMQPTPMLNPRILSHSQAKVKDWEGCLSVPDARGLVPRYQEIKVEYTTPTGETNQKILTDFVARIFQHELDHLDGILFTERVENPADLYTEAEYRQILKIDNI
jgi:peptide deformylase